MNCILIDDEQPALDLLEDNIRQIPYLKVIGSFRKPLQALEVMKSQPVDLVFLDIQMPGINGLDLLRALARPPMVILVTAYGEHALDGYNLDVVDYLLKPVPFLRFLKAVEKAHSLFQLRQAKDEKPVAASGDDFVFVNANYSLVRIRIQDISFIEGMKDYVRINVFAGKPVTIRMGLKNIEERLGTERFMRIHKSYIVALDKIEAVQKTQLLVAGAELPIGEGYRQGLLAYIAARNL